MKSLAIYYAQVIFFIAASYGLLLLIYGQIRVSFFSWTIILLIVFTLVYVPTLFRLLNDKTQNGSGSIN